MNLLLESHGIDAEIIGSTDSGVLGSIGAPNGFKLVVDSCDWEMADKIITDTAPLQPAPSNAGGETEAQA